MNTKILLGLFLLKVVKSELICSDISKNECLDLTEEELKQWHSPFYVDHFGHKMNWTDLKNGWSQHRRLEWIHFRHSDAKS